MSTDTLYHVVCVNDRDNTVTPMTATPCTHAEACTIKSKMIPDSRRPAHVRTQLMSADYFEALETL